MKEQNISKLIATSLLGQLSSEEQEQLDEWLNSDDGNRQLFDELSKELGKELDRLDSIDSKAALKAMKKRLHGDADLSNRSAAALSGRKGTEHRRGRRHYELRWLSAAAVILIIVGVAFFSLIDSKEDSQVATVSSNQIIHGSTRAFVYLDDGQEISLGSDVNADRQALSVISHDGYDGMITMRTPRGGEFAMTLPDSTQVWLNAESSISYPADFDKNIRKVAITGEAYFKVRHDAQWPFEVETEGQTVRVLGTEFNINAYDEGHVITTLYNGSIAVSAIGSGKGFVLSPGQSSDFTSSNKSFQNIDVDTAAVKGWLHGRFVFENQSFGRIMRELSRWYNFHYSFKDHALASTVFMGSVPRYGDFREVLNILEKSGGITFKVKGKEVTIEKR